MSDPFGTPSSGQKITDFDGRLLLCTPEEMMHDITTSNGVADDVLSTRVVVLDAKTGPVAFDGVWIFQKKLIGQLKSKLPKGDEPAGMLLGRLGREAEAAKGKSPAWVLTGPTEAEKQVARDYLASLAKDPFATAN